jgi:outer membrane receptor protein involved in Fe transport
LAGGSAWSQESSGGIRGSIQDADFYVPVVGVQIQLESTGQSAVTDSEGRFFINAVPPGEYTLMARRNGYISGRRSGVVVNVGSVREVSLDLTAEVVELDEFVVTAEETVENELTTLDAVNLTRPLASFASALGRDFIAKSGGGDIGSAVKRLAGTSVVDSRYVVIRGLSDRYNVVVLNGARLPSSDPDKRAVNIDLFPSSLVENVINSKTYTPDLPGETTGGYLNIVTRNLPDKPFVNFSYGTAHNTQATRNPNFHTYRGGGTGFLGSGQSRALPGFLAATDQNSLPAGPASTNIFGAVGPDAATVELRDRAALSLANTTMGVSTKEAPEDFNFSLSGGLTLDDFLGGKLGLVGAVTYAKTYRLRIGKRESIQQATPGPPPTYQLKRSLDYTEGEEGLLAGLLLAAGWEGPNDDTISLTYFTNIAAEDVAQFATGEDSEFAGDDPNDNLPATVPYIRETLAYTERRLSTLQLRGEHRFPEHNDMKIDWTAAYSWAYQNQPDLRSANYLYDIANGTYGSLGAAFDGFPFERIWRRLDDTNFNAAVNFEIPFAEGGDGEDKAKLKFGMSLDRSDRKYRTDNFAYSVDFNPLNPFLTPPAGQAPTANDANGPGLGDQITELDQTPSFDVIPGLFTIDNTFLLRPGFPDAVEEYTGFQNIAAGYAMTTFTMGPKTEFIAGARAEMTDIKVKGGGRPSNANAAAFFQGLTDEQIRNPSIQSADLLPALAINYELGENVRMRSSLTRTIARPTFKEIAAVFTRDPATGIIFFGNPGLQRSDIWNYDLRTEWFPEPGDSVVLSFFSKSISKPIEAQNLGSFATVINENAGLIYGLEFEISKQLKDWDPVLRDVRLGFNYSKIFSQVELTDQSKADRQAAGLPLVRPLQGQPEYTMNFNVIYDNKDWGFSAAAFLNVTGPMLYQTGGVAGTNVGLDVFQETFTSVDVSLSKEVADGWKLGFRINNLLNQPIRRVYRDGRGVVGAFDTRLDGITYSLALSRAW